MSPKKLRILKFGLFALMVVVLYSQCDWSGVWANLIRINPGWFALGVLVFALQIVLASYRWRSVIETVGFKVPGELVLASSRVSFKPGLDSFKFVAELKNGTIQPKLEH